MTHCSTGLFLDSMRVCSNMSLGGWPYQEILSLLMYVVYIKFPGNDKLVITFKFKATL